MKLYIAVFILLFFIGCERKVDYLPSELYGLTLVKKISGGEAKSYVNKLHFDQVTDEENEIGFYRGEEGEAIIYITYYDNYFKAHSKEVEMTKKISPENSVFRDGEYIEIEKVSVYRTFGMGQTHFVFTLNNNLFWISSETVWAEDFVTDYINQYK